MNIVVTGSGGFLGKELICQLINKNRNVIALTSQTDRLNQLYENNNKLTVLSNDYIINGFLKFEEDDILINCAFPRTNNFDYVAEGLDYVQKTIKESVKNGLKNIINISSQSVYGEKRNYIVDENSKVILDSVYATGKYSTELFTEMISDDVKKTNIRLGSLIGPGFNQRFINRMTENALNTGTINCNNSNIIYSFLDVEDAARAIVRLIDISSNDWKFCYNLGGDLSYTMKDIALCIKECIQNKTNKTINLNVAESSDNGDLRINNDQIKKDMGDYNYQYNSLSDSVNKIIDYFLKDDSN